MAMILIAYATTEGQTRKVAQAVADVVTGRGDDARLVDLVEAPKNLDPADFDVVFVAASIHAGHYQSAARHFVRSHADKLAVRPSAFISVSLSAVAGEQGGEEDAERCARKFLDETGWAPREVYHAAGALRFSRYDFLKKWIMRQIARSHGYRTHGEDVEFTDWRALDTFVAGFLSAQTPQA